MIESNDNIFLQMNVQTCLVPICHGKGELQTFKFQAIKTLILFSISIDDGLHLYQ